VTDGKSDCEALLEAVLPFAERMLATDREFFPYGGAMKSDGEIVSIGGLSEGDEPPAMDSVIGVLKTAFVAGARAGTYRATALVSDVSVTPEDGEASNAIAAALDHADGYSVIVLLPYAFEGKDLLFGEISAQAGAREVFPERA
jgi:hypothetical protein